ncbi:MAG: glycerophosphodiester phosphodiesterase [Bacteroidetes bacterium]|nr:glycerophosphodiester phosphodiesterase [Bacteroidota bacterium]
MLIPLREYDFDRLPMICAHRGDTSLGAAENSLEAVGTALSSGAEMVEVDIQFTSTGDIVCHHDEIERGGVYERFEDIATLAAGKMYLNIELKGYGVIDEMPFIPGLLQFIDKIGMSERTLYSSFRPDYIKALSQRAITTIIHPTAEMSGYLGLQGIEELLPSELIRLTGAATYACSLEELEPRRLEDIRDNSIHLSVYTINTQAEFDAAMRAGAKAMVTDVPRQLVKMRAA